MSMIKEINKTINDENKLLHESFNIISQNSNYILDESCITLCESAESFLGTVVAKINAGRELDPKNTEVRNIFGVIAALDLMRYPQARKVIDSNSVKAYLDVINGVETATTLNQTEIKLLHNLEYMKNDNGVSGMDVRVKYLDLAKSNPTELLAVINKLRSQYGSITSKLKTSLASQAASTQGATAPVASQATSPTV